MNRRLLASTIGTLDAEVFALTHPPAPGLPGPEVRCIFVADDLRLLRDELAEELARSTNPPADTTHRPDCRRDEDGVIEACAPDCPNQRALDGVF